LTNAHNKDYDRPIPQAKLKGALDKELALLGRPIQDMVIEQLMRYGITFANDKQGSYSLKQLQSTFEQLFGVEAAILLIERLDNYLQSGNPGKSETNGSSHAFLI